MDGYEDDYLIFDCPGKLQPVTSSALILNSNRGSSGQIELYTHFPIMKSVCETLQKWNFNICGLYLIESQFIEDVTKYFSGVLSALSAMINLEIPHINVMTKMDLLSEDAKESLKGIMTRGSK